MRRLCRPLYVNSMNQLTRAILIISILSVSNVFGATPETKFWKWFQKNEEGLFHFEKDRERIFDELSIEMRKVSQDLTFEFGPVTGEGKREFVISAGGIKNAFPQVESLAESAPDLEKWIFVKYRQRREPLNDLEFGGVSIAANDVHFKMFQDGEKVGIVLFFADQNEAQSDIYANIGYLMLDEALGELDIETKVGFIEFHNRESEYFEGSQLLLELAEAFDSYFENQN